MRKSKENKKKLCVIGLGYVGLPLALRSLERGYDVFGVDLDRHKILLIKRGKSPFKERFIERKLSLLKKLKAGTNPKVIKKADISIICVPTPVDDKYYPILEPLKSAVKAVINNLPKGQLVIIESTINPGVCEDVVAPMFKKAGYSEGSDYFLAHCPERIDPGNPKYNVSNISRVLGALSPEGLMRAYQYYSSIIDAPIKKMRSIREAEAVKVVENSFRDINIAFVNELAKSFDRMGIDTVDVIEGAATKPFAFMPHWPSRGVGGHCIPVDPYYLIERAKESGFDHRFLRIAREINNSMPAYTVDVLEMLLKELNLSIKKEKIGILGLSYKANIDDMRESPALKIIKELKRRKANVLTFDPYASKMCNTKSLEEILKKSTALILATAHRDFLKINPIKYKNFGIKAIVDGMNKLPSARIKALGIKYHGIGRS